MQFCTSKDKDSILDYGFDWGTYYLAQGDTIVSSIWTCEDSNLSILSDGISPDQRSTSVVVSGGLNGKSYNITNRIALNDGVRQVERTITLVIAER
tara:strand:+ start:41 stop:328 length:288 start_codon:yes stop_codon:yes gene_type:complete